MKKLLIYCISTFVLSSIFSYLFYIKIMAAGVVQQKLTILDYCSENNDDNDVIFIGASRVQSHINPRIIDSIAQVKSYCITINAIGIVEDNMVLKKYLQNHPKPDAVFLNIDFNMFYTSGPLNNVTDFLPYLNDTLIYNELSPYKTVYRNKWVAYYYLLQKIFATTDKSKAKAFSIGFNEKPAVETKLAYKGFLPRIFNWSEEAERDMQTIKTATYQKEGFDLLKKIIKTCRHDSIELVFIYAPILTEAKSRILNFNEIIDQVKAIAIQEGVQYLDYSFMPLCNSKKYFFNYNHLNYDGANIYSTQLALDIKKMLDQKSELKNQNKK